MTTITLTDQNFESEVLGSSSVVLVDYWATWCGPCKTIAPSLEELSDELVGKVVIGKIDVDMNPATPTKYGIRGVPTLALFKGGELIATKVGPVPKSQLLSFIKQAF